MILTPDQEDTIKELFNIGAGHAAGALSELTHCHIELSIPSIQIVKFSDLKQGHERLGTGDYASVRMHFKGFMEGSAALVFPPESALKLIAAVSEDETATPDMDSLKSGVLTEIGNIIISQILSVISNTFQQRLEYSVPFYVEGPIAHMVEAHDSPEEMAIMIIDTMFNIKELKITGDVILFLKISELANFVETVESLLR